MRMQRISPDEPLVYQDPTTKQDWIIPAGTSVSMDALSVSMNPKIFPEPQRYLPERWIGNKGLDKYLLTFSKGTRMCAGWVSDINAPLASSGSLAYDYKYQSCIC